MRGKQKVPDTIDEYVAGFSPEVRKRLQLIRNTILAVSPEATELISYRIPAFKLHGKILIYFAGFQEHIGMYPAPRGEPEFEKDLAKYGAGKGTFRFPLDQPVPVSLIKRLVKHKARLIDEALKSKLQKKPKPRKQTKSKTVK